MNIEKSPTLLKICFIFCLISCKYSGPKHRYSGYQNVISVNEINSVAGISNGKVIDLKIPMPEKSNFDYNKMLDSISFIKLKTTPESLIGKIDKIFFTENEIIIVDFKITQSVFIFNINGDFINKISTSKKSSNQNNDLSNFMDVAYYFNTGEIVLHDNRKSKLYYFDNNGHFKRTEKEYVSFFSFANLGGTDKFVYLDLYTQNDHIPQLLKSDLYLGKQDTRITHIAPEAVQRVKINDKYHYEYNLSSYNSKKKLFYTPVFSDTIYQIDGQPLTVYPKFVLHYPGEDLVTKIKESMNVGMNEFNDLFNSHQYFSFQGKVLCNQDSIYYIGCYKNGLLGFFYSEKSKKIIGGNLRSALTNKDSVKLESFEYPTATFNNYFVSIIKSSDFVELENLNTLYSLNLSKVIKASKVNDNPVLVLYKLKSF